MAEHGRPERQVQYSSGGEQLRDGEWGVLADVDLGDVVVVAPAVLALVVLAVARADLAGAVRGLQQEDQFLLSQVSSHQEGSTPLIMSPNYTVAVLTFTCGGLNHIMEILHVDHVKRSLPSPL